MHNQLLIKLAWSSITLLDYFQKCLWNRFHEDFFELILQENVNRQFDRDIDLYIELMANPSLSSD